MRMRNDYHRMRLSIRVQMYVFLLKYHNKTGERQRKRDKCPTGVNW